MKTSAYVVSAEEMQLSIGPAFIQIAYGMAEPLADALEAAMNGEYPIAVRDDAFGQSLQVTVFLGRYGKGVTLVSGDMHLSVPAATARRAAKELRRAIAQAVAPMQMPIDRLADHPEAVEGIVYLETCYAEQDGTPMCWLPTDLVGTSANAH